MAGTVEGGHKAVKTNKSRYGEDFYSRIGSKGAEAYRKRQKEGVAKPRGFALNPHLAIIAGAKGGRRSKRRKFKRAHEIKKV